MDGEHNVHLSGSEVSEVREQRSNVPKKPFRVAKSLLPSERFYSSVMLRKLQHKTGNLVVPLLFLSTTFDGLVALVEKLIGKDTQRTFMKNVNEDDVPTIKESKNGN